MPPSASNACAIVRLRSRIPEWLIVRRSMLRVDAIERAAIGEMRTLRRRPVAEITAQWKQLGRGEFAAMRCGNGGRSRPVVMTRGDLLRLRRVQEFQVRLRNNTRAALVDDLVDDRHRRFRDDADRRHDDLDVAAAQLAYGEVRFVLPDDQPIADAALDEGRR